MLKAVQLTKKYGVRTLFDNVNFHINPSEKVGLAGRNGSGKTTLFRLIIGEEEHDSGEIETSKNYKIGYVSQHLHFVKDTVVDEGALGLSKERKDDIWLVKKYLFGLGFNEELLAMNPKKLSGGFQIRLNLVKTLLGNPNLLLLDEPTNYLDITSIRWLIQFLKAWKGELFLITHDRGFMDEVVTHTMIIHRCKVRKIPGTTDKLYEQIAQEEEILEKQRLNEEKKQKNVELFISRFRAKARLAGLVQSRIKALEKKEKKDKLVKLKDLDFEFKYAPFNAQILLQTHNLKFSYNNELELLKGISFNIHKNDRIAIVGPNGRGKSTLLKVLTEKLTQQSGEIKKHSNLKIGYYAQTNDIDLHPDNTVEEEIALASPDNDQQSVRGICGAMLFEQDDALKKIKVLSGGEKSRVLLGKILAESVNLLILDEPTNHLDMESCDALLAAIDNFDGAVIFVTHTEMFLNLLADRLIVFDNNKVTLFEGTYHEFLTKIGWANEKELKTASANSSNTDIDNSPNKKELRKQRAKILEEKSKIVKPIENKFHKLEAVIQEHENKLSMCENEIIEASKQKNGVKIETLSKEIHQLEKTIAEHYEKLEIIMEELEEASKVYEEKMENLAG